MLNIQIEIKYISHIYINYRKKRKKFSVQIRYINDINILIFLVKIWLYYVKNFYYNF